MDAGQNITGLFTEYRYAVGLIVPLCIVIFGVLGKKIARGPKWMREDFYVGSEMTLAGVADSLVNIFDLLKPDKTIGLLEKKLIGGNIAIVIFGLICFYVALSLHQDFGPSSGKSTKKQLFFLLLVSNVIGLATLIGALLLMSP